MACQHYIACPYGMRRQVTAHNPVRDCVGEMMRCAYPGARVIVEGEGGNALSIFMQRYPLVLHRPDIVIDNFDGRGTYLLIDIKTVAPTGRTFRRTKHTDETRLAAQQAREDTLHRDYFGASGRLPRTYPPMLLRCFAISAFGTLGRQAQTLVKLASSRCHGTVPPAVADEATWASANFQSFWRQAAAVAVHGGLAAAVRASTYSAENYQRLQQNRELPAPPAARTTGSWPRPTWPRPPRLAARCRDSVRRPA